MRSPVSANAALCGECPSAPAPSLAEALDQLGHIHHLLSALATSAYAIQPEALGVIADAMDARMDALRAEIEAADPQDPALRDLLAATAGAEAEHAAACEAGDDAAQAAAAERLEQAIADMANLPAEGLRGIAAKAARLCRSLADGGEGATVISYADAPLARSLAADLARLAPEVMA